MATKPTVKSNRAAGVQEGKKTAPCSREETAADPLRDLLHEREKQLRLAQTAAESGTWDLNLKTNELVWSPENYRLYGIEPEAFKGRIEDWRGLVHPEDIERVDRQRRDAIEQKSAYSTEYRIRHGSGAIHWIASKGKAYYDDQGKPLRMLGVTIDITERKRAEEALRESQARLAGIVETAMDAIVSVDAAQRITLFNSAAEKMFGCSAAEAIGQPLERFVPEKFRASHWRHVERFGKEKTTGRRMGELGEITGLRANGEEFPIEASISQLEVGGQKLYTVILRDITSRARALASLRESDERARSQLGELQSIYASAPVGLCLLGRDLRFLRINEHLAQMNGAAPEHHIGRTVRELLPQLADVIEPKLREVLETGRPRFKEEIVGETPAEPGVDRTWLTSCLPLKDANGQITGINVVVEEITERKRLEEELKQHAKTLEEADRRKDEFIAMLAHELRNPLAPIRSAVEMLGLCDASDPDFHWGRNVIDQQVKHLARLLDDLLDLSRVTGNKLELKKERVLLSDVVNAALEASRPIIEQRSHQVSVTMPLKPIYLHADTVRLTQVFINLINNAAKYTPPGGRIGVSADLNEDFVTIRVTDNGMGISAAQLPYVFDMFYQADRSYEQAYGGLGIGLTLVKRLVEMHGGSVEVHSRGANQGSEFIVRLPIVAEPVRAAVDKASSERKGHIRRRILVVDDYPNAAEGLARWLRRLQHEVRVAFDGLQGIEAAEQFQPEIVLLDIGMPKLNGYETAERIRQQPWGKQMVLVALTGWGQAEDRERSREAGFDLHLVKPVDYGQLRALLERIPGSEGEPGTSALDISRAEQ